jgi:hypothetical protein
VEVQAGDVVEKDQPLVVIESMKMETVIRSPQRGTIARVVHQQGVSHMVPSPFFLLFLIPFFFFTRFWTLVCFSSSGLDWMVAISQLGAAQVLGSRDPTVICSLPSCGGHSIPECSPKMTFSVTNLKILLTYIAGPMQEWDAPSRIRRRTRVSVKE